MVWIFNSVIANQTIRITHRYQTYVVYDIIVHMHKNSFYVCVGGNHFELEGQTKVILIKKQKSCNNM